MECEGCTGTSTSGLLSLCLQHNHHNETQMLNDIVYVITDCPTGALFT